MILTQDKQGFSRHPETLRWRGKLQALYLRHEALVAEMGRRGYRHHTPLPAAQATGLAQQDEYQDSPARAGRNIERQGLRLPGLNFKFRVMKKQTKGCQ